LLLQLGRLEDVVRTTDGVANSGEMTATLCVLRGTALRGIGQHAAALSVFGEALCHSSDMDRVYLQARLERGLTHLEMGQPDKALEDLISVQVEDGAFPGLREAMTRADSA